MDMLIRFGDSEDLNNLFFTADQHFGHENIIKFTGRPFATVDEMDTAMIERWNKVIPPNGTVFHLGDFTLGDPADAERYFSQLNGNVQVLDNPWHHDRRWLIDKHYRTKSGYPVELISPLVVLELPFARERPLIINLCHYPLAVWDRKHYAAWHLHGHSHGKHQYTDDASTYAIDVGVDCWNFHPLSFGGILEVMYERGWM
jgi:calcineurin-like phosphoesterase family protein